ncbi:hypothetical protein [Candidatus Poriferisocius sp.]|uniref:hypothetical protein n=1 Tax=Candidatus Poriferisocius sp. TaxID=3101276 RepID=UPI003B011D46
MMDDEEWEKLGPVGKTTMGCLGTIIFGTVAFWGIIIFAVIIGGFILAMVDSCT